MKKRIVLALAAVFTFSMLNSLPVIAAAPTAPLKAVTVSPAIEQLQLAEGQDSADFKVTIANHTDVLARISLTFSDFKSLNASGGIAFLGQNASDLDHSHGLSKWVQLQTEQVGLEPNQSAEINIHLTDLQSISPGGHYGAIIYQVVPYGAIHTGNRVNLQQALSTLVFAVTAGGGTQHIKLAPPGLSHLQFSLPGKLNLLFSNDGNTQTAPRGSVQVYGGDPKTPAATAIINNGSALVLPGSSRNLTTSLTKAKHPWWPGIYHVRIRYRADSATGFSTYNARFLYLNPLATALMALIIVMAAGTWRFLAKRPSLRRIAHTAKVESILVWRDFKLLIKYIFKRNSKTVNKAAKKPKK